MSAALGSLPHRSPVRLQLVIQSILNRGERAIAECDMGRDLVRARVSIKKECDMAIERTGGIHFMGKRGAPIGRAAKRLLSCGVN